MLEQILIFPTGFLWGAATSAYQVEGGNSNSDWWAWEQEGGHIVDGSRSGVAAEWWSGRAEDDLRRAAELGHTAHRMSIEWSRLEPQPGVWDEEAFARYREILGTVRALGMEPFVTLFHFSLPQWAAAEGGWTNGDLPTRFARFVTEAVYRLGDLVEWWATINEPMTLLYSAYLHRLWPPGRGSFKDTLVVMGNLARAHHAAYRAGKEVDRDARIGIVVNQPEVDPDRDRLLDRGAAALRDLMINRLFLEVLEWGGRDDVDWYGLNYYGRFRVRFDPTRPRTLFARNVQDGVSRPKASWGAVYPPGLTERLRRLGMHGKPLFVTENGIYDQDDSRRAAYLLQHLRALHEALQRGVDVRGYFHWSLIDNFEWHEGWSTPFGLIEMNPATQTRRLRPSATVYQAVIRHNGITPALWGEVVGAGTGLLDSFDVADHKAAFR